MSHLLALHCVQSRRDQLRMTKYEVLVCYILSPSVLVPYVSSLRHSVMLHSPSVFFSPHPPLFLPVSFCSRTLSCLSVSFHVRAGIRACVPPPELSLSLHISAVILFNRSIQRHDSESRPNADPPLSNVSISVSQGKTSQAPMCTPPTIFATKLKAPAP